VRQGRQLAGNGAHNHTKDKPHHARRRYMQSAYLCGFQLFANVLVALCTSSLLLLKGIGLPFQFLLCLLLKLVELISHPAQVPFRCIEPPFEAGIWCGIVPGTPSPCLMKSPYRVRLGLR
jgi:hypothetical protein